MRARLLASLALVVAVNGSQACQRRSSASGPDSAAQTDPAPGPKRPSPRRTLPPAKPDPPAPSDMLLVPAGPFVRGADQGGEQDERPAHRVTLKAFWLDRTEVTNVAYAACVKAGRCRSPRKRSWHPGPRLPVTGVSWDDAHTYCRWRGKRLPTEAEFEKAVRGTDGRRYPWGSAAPTPAHTIALGRPRPEPVGSRPKGRGPYGHDDLAGNVWEWVQDEYDPIAYRRPGAPEGVPGSCPEILATLQQLRREKQQGFTGSNPLPTGCERVLRGGAYNYPADGLRSTNRVHHPRHWRIKVAGFRCARDGAFTGRRPAAPVR